MFLLVSHKLLTPLFWLLAHFFVCKSFKLTIILWFRCCRCGPVSSIRQTFHICLAYSVHFLCAFWWRWFQAWSLCLFSVCVCLPQALLQVFGSNTRGFLSCCFQTSDSLRRNVALSSIPRKVSWNLKCLRNPLVTFAFLV